MEGCSLWKLIMEPLVWESEDFHEFEEAFLQALKQ
jgi:hypothetical protein